MAKWFLIIVGILISLGVAGGVFYCYLDNLHQGEILIDNSARFSKPSQFSLASGIVPHHLVAEEIIRDFFKYISFRENPETIILLSPDYFNSGNIIKGNSFITLEPDVEKFDDLVVDKFLLQNLSKEIKKEIVFNNSFLVSDHGITNLLPYIKLYFPEAKILPILVPSNIDKRQIKHLIESINSYASPETIIIASVDFSHYLSKNVAEFHDVKSIRTLINFEKQNFENLETDCWQCLYGARLFAKLKNKEFPNIIAHKNSADFLKAMNQEETTSYFSVVFEKPTFAKATKDKGNLQEARESRGFNEKTILFVGDIMLDRAVERLMRKNSIFYPFQKINQLTKGIDIVFGNLEGPIMENPPNFSDKSLKFAFSPDVVEGLKFANFNLFSLANNHTLNMRESGLEETKEFLEEKNINFVGDPLKCTEDFSYQEDKIIFFAFNKTYPSGCSDEEIVDVVKSVRLKNPQKFLIISIHWGKEYQLRSSTSQQKLAHKIIDTGADLIIGHHPHTVQEIEIYKNKLIFYSLGNFVFDQYFSKDTQQGLTIGLEIYPNKLICRLFPIQSKLSQPFLMVQKEAEEFLEKLADRSHQDLFGQIKRGIIEIEKVE